MRNTRYHKKKHRHERPGVGGIQCLKRTTTSSATSMAFSFIICDCSGVKEKVGRLVTFILLSLFDFFASVAVAAIDASPSDGCG